MGLQVRAEGSQDSDGRRHSAGAMGVEISDGRMRIWWNDTEVVREIDCPVRDPDWRTLPVEQTDEALDLLPLGFRWRRAFRTTDRSLQGELTVEATGTSERAHLVATLALTALRPTEVNRAGFVLLHPILGVAGTPLVVHHADGSRETTAFPQRISPGQPVRDIAALEHRVGAAKVEIAFTGEVFEMEDQRNWSDASFKTYCRPLSRPRPYRLAPGETVGQSIRIDLSSARCSAATTPAVVAPADAVMPRIQLAHDPETAPEALPATIPPVDGLILRTRDGLPLPPLPAVPLTLEIVTDASPADEIGRIARACQRAGLRPRRVVAMPRSYLASHQPEGPWPQGPRPLDLVPLLRAAFPSAEVGGGALTNFTEFNRCRPDPDAIDFATFGTTAIVHAAADRAVAETLEALPEIFASAAALVPGRPLHLGLVAIGMRSNPYGAGVAPNPDRRRLPMAMEDPRQRAPFAAAFAIAAAAAAARSGVASFAPAMANGPLGLGPDAAPWPLREAVAALAALGGRRVRIEGGPTGPVVIRGEGLCLAANLAPRATERDGLRLEPFGFSVRAVAA